MKVRLFNDWRYLFSKNAMGGRFASFTIIHIGYLRVAIPEADGVTIVLLGLGVRVGGADGPAN